MVASLSEDVSGVIGFLLNRPASDKLLSHPHLIIDAWCTWLDLVSQPIYPFFHLVLKIGQAEALLGPGCSKENLSLT
jgi:hypothetical protein